MMSVKLKRSITEVLEILKYMDKSYTEKIPKKFIRFLQDNKDASYIFELDYTKSIPDYNISKETKKLLGVIYLKYWSNLEQQKEYLQILDKNQQIYEEEIKEKYNVDKLFKKEKIVEISKMILKNVHKL